MGYSQFQPCSPQKLDGKFKSATYFLGELRQAILKVGGIHWGTYFSQFEWFNPIYLNDKKNHTSNYVNVRNLLTNFKQKLLI